MHKHVLHKSKDITSQWCPCCLFLVNYWLNGLVSVGGCPVDNRVFSYFIADSALPTICTPPTGEVAPYLPAVSSSYMCLGHKVRTRLLSNSSSVQGHQGWTLQNMMYNLRHCKIYTLYPQLYPFVSFSFPIKALLATWFYYLVSYDVPKCRSIDAAQLAAEGSVNADDWCSSLVGLGWTGHHDYPDVQKLQGCNNCRNPVCDHYCMDPRTRCFIFGQHLKPAR